jgi:Cd2+/Zn2+-exporting ATPase
MTFDAALLFYLILSLGVSYGQTLSKNVADVLLIIGGVVGILPVVLAALKSLQKKKITVDLLASVALIFSLYDRQWQSAVFITMMITSARIFGDYTENKARLAIQSLLKLRPETVRVKEGNTIVIKSISAVKRGDLVVVESGDRVPIDGKVIEGQASIDQSSLTGESIPIEKQSDDLVFSSTLNVSGSIIVKAEKVGEDTTLEKIIRLVEYAQSGKANIQTAGDRFATWYITITFFGALALLLFTKNVTFVLSVLLVTCADDIAVAIPLAFWAAVGYAAKRGIIVKGGNFIEGVAQIRTLVVDKTGTITKGQIHVQNFEVVGHAKKSEVIQAAIATSVVSKHPISKAIFAYGMRILNKKNVSSPERFREYPGKGITAYENHTEVIVGNKKFLEAQGVSFSYDIGKRIQQYENHGLSVVVVSRNGTCVGLITLADQVRENIPLSIAVLKNLGVERVIMLSGDNEQVTKRIANEVGIDEYHAGMLPEDKVAFIEENARKKGKLAMVGDGVNDAAALARADIGIAMGVIGSDAAIESADIALMKDDFSKIAEVMTIGRYTVNIAKENFIIWGLVNIIGLGLVFGGIIGPSGAAAYNFMTDFLPLFNSMRILRFHLFPTLRMKVLK